MKRRSFLATLGAAGLAPVSVLSLAGQPAGLAYLSVRSDRRRRSFVAGIDVKGRLRFDLPLPARAHGIAVHPSREEAVVIARRPGTFLQTIDLRQGRLLETVHCTPLRHLYGHGVYSRDGRLLYTTENDFEAARGVIAVRDAGNGYRQIDEFDSGGIGPHELCLMPDGDTLAVANGGIRTHPDFDRTPLNLEDMQPSLVYIDRRSGQLLESRQLPKALHRNSIRHLAVGSGERVCMAMQYQGPRDETPPLIALHRRGEPLQLLAAPQAILAQMRNYCGSVCADASGQYFAVSSPRGDLVTFWSLDGGYLDYAPVQDGCGIAASAGSGTFILSSGLGGLYRYTVATGELERMDLAASQDVLWDNHMSALT